MCTPTQGKGNLPQTWYSAVTTSSLRTVRVLAEAPRVPGEGILTTEIDLERLIGERRRNTTFQNAKERTLPRIPFALELSETALTRSFASRPFVPSEEGERNQRCEEILTIQAKGLEKRLAHTHARSAVVGISRRPGILPWPCW